MRVLSVLVLALIGVVFAGGEQKETYANHRLMGYTPKNLEEVKFLQQLAIDAALQLDFWSSVAVNHMSTFRVPPESYQILKGRLRQHRIRAITLHDNLQELMEDNLQDAEEKSQKLKNAKPLFSGLGDHTKYHRYSYIDDLLSAFEAGFPTLVRKNYLAPQTVEGRSLAYVEISTDFTNTKPMVLIESGLHAREWISPAVALYFIDRLLHTRVADAEGAGYLLDKYDWMIIPVANPDGYEYSHTNSRMWRKNRSPCSGSSFRGVDLNRNFDAMWNTTGVSTRCSSDTWPGASVFSERESQAIRNYVLDNLSRMTAYISLHSYSQMIFFPYGYERNTYAPNRDELEPLAVGAANAIRNTHGKVFRVGTAGDILYAASGGSDDWAHLAGVRHVWTYELRPHENDWQTGFQLPPSEIIPSGEELWESFVHIGQNMNP